MSENIERLETAIRDSGALAHEGDCPICDVLRAALDAVEHEIAALQASYDELRKDCGACEDAAEALEAERDELRRRGEMADGCLDMIHEKLVWLLGEDGMKGCPAMMYPEAIQNACLRAARGEFDERIPEHLRRRTEKAELRRKCPDCGSPMPGEMCAVCALAHAEVEIVELRKRPTLEEVEARVRSVFSTTEYAIGTNRGYARDWVLEAIRALYAEKTAR